MVHNATDPLCAISSGGTIHSFTIFKGASSVSSHVHVSNFSVSGEVVSPMGIFDLLLHGFFSPPTVYNFLNWQIFANSNIM